VGDYHSELDGVERTFANNGDAGCRISNALDGLDPDNEVADAVTWLDDMLQAAPLENGYLWMDTLW